jgi:nucleotidyltransferase substrate binding protein (TIGR01987 family)
MKRLTQIISDYKKALKSLTEAVDIAKSDLEIDGVIQRFEFTFELFWKSLKIYLENEGISAKSPRQVLKESYSLGLFSDEKTILKMLDDRNETTYLYDEDSSREIYNRIKENYLSIFQDILNKIEPQN